MSCNGYTNYATYIVAVWVDNDQRMYSYFENLVQCAHRDNYDAVETMESHLKDIVKFEFHEVDYKAFARDLVNALLEEVNFREVAESFVESFS